MRHQNCALKEQQQQILDKLHGVEDRGYVGNFKLQRLETMVSGGLGLQMEMAQRQAQAGQLIPGHGAAVAQRQLDLTTGSKLTAAAQQRTKAEHRWLAKKQSAAIKALKLQEESSIAAKFSALSSDNTGEEREQSSTAQPSAKQQTAAQPSAAQHSHLLHSHLLHSHLLRSNKLDRHPCHSQLLFKSRLADLLTCHQAMSQGTMAFHERNGEESSRL